MHTLHSRPRDGLPTASVDRLLMALAKQLDGWAVADNGKVILYQLFIAIYIHLSKEV